MAKKTNGQAGAAPATGLSKKDLVRQAIGHLGHDAKPLQIQAHIKAKFGVEMSPNHISASKTEILREAASRAKPATASSAKPAVAKSAAPKKTAPRKPTTPKSAAKTTTAPKKAVAPALAGGHVASSGNRTTGISLHDIQAAKDLVGRVGAGQLRALIDLLAK